MKIFELSKELSITNKELISFLNQNNYSVCSHMQNMTDEMIELARNNFKLSETNEQVIEEIKNLQTNINEQEQSSTRVFKADDEIICKSVTPWKLTAVGVDKKTVYHWEYFGDIDYVKYRDLQALRRTDYITKPSIIIMDKDLRKQWSRELKDTYKYFENINYPEEYFLKSDSDFEDILQNAPVWVKEIIKTTALTMVKVKNYPSLNKIILIDKILGTCIKDFL